MHLPAIPEGDFGKRLSPARFARFALLRPLCVLLTLCLLLTGCPSSSPTTPDVIVLHTGRLVGNVYPMGPDSPAPLQYYPYVAGYVKAVREEARKSGAQVILVDMGDSLTGSFASQVTGSENMVTFFNELGYDAVSLGNLDTDIPAEVLKKLNAQVLCPFETEASEPAVPGTSPLASFVKGRTQISILSNFYGDTDSSTNPYRFPFWFGPYENGIRPVRDYKTVAKNILPGGLLLFSWMKFEPPDQPPEEYLKSLRTLKVDAILAHRIYGHRDIWSEESYLGWKPPVSENILRRNGGFTVARIDLVRDGQGWKVLRRELIPMTANTAPADQGIIQKIEKFSKTIQDADSTICELENAADRDKINRWMLGSLTAIPGVDAVAYSPDSIRDEWSQGALKASQVFNAVPWVNPLAKIYLTEEQLKNVRHKENLRVWTREDAQGPSYVMVTSRYFAALIQREFGLPPENVEVLQGTSEFEFLLRYLSKTDALDAEGIPPRWKDE